MVTLDKLKSFQIPFAYSCCSYENFQNITLPPNLEKQSWVHGISHKPDNNYYDGNSNGNNKINVVVKKQTRVKLNCM